MKEVLTKKFWKDVKKTFDEALEGPPAKANDQSVAKVEANSEPGAPTKEHDVPSVLPERKSSS